MKSCDAVLEALTEQVACYRRLAKLAQVQHEHVRQGRTEQLLEVLKSRQELLERMAASETILAPAKRHWPQFLAELDDGARLQAEGLLAETRTLLERITAADRDDALVLQQRKLNLGRQINQAASARQINRTYGVAAYGRRPARMDLQR